MMKLKLCGISTAVCALAMIAAWSVPASAQDEMKEKPPMYSYVGNWGIPRAHWADMEKNDAADRNVLEKALANGTIIAYGSDVNLVHQQDGPTHDSWWSSMSMAGLLNVLDQFYKNGSSTSSVLSSATRHSDEIMVSRYYGWHPGSFKGALHSRGRIQTETDAPNDAVEMLSKNLFVPLMEKMLADGTFIEYEIDTEAIHTQDPNSFWVVFIAANADGLDKFNAALRESTKKNPMVGPTIGAMIDYTPHRDYLSSSIGTYK